MRLRRVRSPLWRSDAPDRALPTAADPARSTRIASSVRARREVSYRRTVEHGTCLLDDADPPFVQIADRLTDGRPYPAACRRFALDAYFPVLFRHRLPRPLHPCLRIARRIMRIDLDELRWIAKRLFRIIRFSDRREIEQASDFRGIEVCRMKSVGIVFAHGRSMSMKREGWIVLLRLLLTFLLFLGVHRLSERFAVGASSHFADAIAAVSAALLGEFFYRSFSNRRRTHDGA
ncbi:hypothetical protein FEP54_03619 [Burkholderia multivorans]|nr:hypothetical protein [Burkholderia multivorans]MDR8924894.1 hypothetical protein [Burkholderia multivorans]MDR8964182.1 hypothetical protein [Burkholderia multivorans]MDR8989007.1 hypothetical protein [Burkholderia multivorans]MDR9020664.1 hypothetical protein [Burkholderia multivorans]